MGDSPGLEPAEPSARPGPPPVPPAKAPRHRLAPPARRDGERGSLCLEPRGWRPAVLPTPAPPRHFRRPDRSPPGVAPRAAPPDRCPPAHRSALPGPACHRSREPPIRHRTHRPPPPRPSTGTGWPSRPQARRPPRTPIGQKVAGRLPSPPAGCRPNVHDRARSDPAPSGAGPRTPSRQPLLPTPTKRSNVLPWWAIMIDRWLRQIAQTP